VVILPDFPTIENLTPTTLVYMKEFNGQTDLLDILYIVGWPMRQKGNHTCSKATISRKLIIPTLLWYRYILHSATPALRTFLKISFGPYCHAFGRSCGHHCVSLSFIIGSLLS